MKLYKNAVFHSSVSQEHKFNYMTVNKGRICGTYTQRPEGRFEEIDLGGRHVYPCLIDGHTHMLLSVAVMAMGFNICEIKDGAVQPSTMARPSAVMSLVSSVPL